MNSGHGRTSRSSQLRERQGCGNAPIHKLILPPPLDSGRLTATQRRAFLRDRSIPLMAPIGVPQSLVNGDRDKIIPTRFATDYATRMRAAGDTVTVRIVPNTGHVELIAPDSAAWAEAKALIAGAFAPSGGGKR